MNLAAIRGALADLLEAITGLQTSAYLLSEPTPPCAMVYMGEIDYDMGFGRPGQRANEVNLVVRVIVPFTADVASQTNLDGYRAGPRSVKDALEVDSDLGGLVDDLRVSSAGPDTLYAGGGIGCEFQVYMLTKGGP